ncbi:hypothetical protein C4T59_17190 [Clostridioides difficile]|nr:hypothetical protein C4J70_03015 [Clostridioides difficile]AVI58846.1 hypothetical protein A6J95_20215 [Clostridioides difficile]EGT3643752.1 hypothetical protein [Clostridioides difficile]EGT3832120.1 hypothetical protein [Clostridioides difficile]EGT3979193.1 hypothetical protein [Clostridioides difficile]
MKFKKQNVSECLEVNFLVYKALFFVLNKIYFHYLNNEKDEYLYFNTYSYIHSFINKSFKKKAI